MNAASKPWGARFLLGAVASVLLAVGLASCGGGDDKPDEIVTEDITDTGDDPFTDPVAPEPSDTVENFADEGASGDSGGNKVAQDSVPDDGLTPEEVAGDQVGLYGGTLDQEECDRQQLIDYLSQDADKARAWTEVQGIPVDQFANYINGLTPMLLTQDTLVINHGYEDGGAYGYLAVLRRGTAVLVDAEGVPRAKCYCGNPLLPPTIPPGYTYEPPDTTTTSTSTSTSTSSTSTSTSTTSTSTSTTSPPTDSDVPDQPPTDFVVTRPGGGPFDPGGFLDHLCEILNLINCPDPPEDPPDTIPDLTPGGGICEIFPGICQVDVPDPWEGFDPADLAEILPARSPIQQFQIQDVATGELVARPLGAAGVDQEGGTTSTTVCIPTEVNITDPNAEDNCVTTIPGAGTSIPGGDTSIPGGDTSIPGGDTTPVTEAPGG